MFGKRESSSLPLESLVRRSENWRLSKTRQKLAYLYSRYPVVSQTFCDSEMIALESLGFEIVVGSLNPPPNTFRHERFRQLEAEIFYPPPAGVLKAEAQSEGFGMALGNLLEQHQKAYGDSFKPEVRARNGYYFWQLFKRLGVGHVHVHFANRATHTALFLREMGLPFSFTAHAQDFMVDLGSDDLLREMCDAAEFVVAVSDFSKGLLQETCPDSADKIIRVYNGIDPNDFSASQTSVEDNCLRIVSVGRLIEFKGFHHLIAACGQLKKGGIAFTCEIIGEGPWRERLESQIDELGLKDQVVLSGIRTQEEVKKSLTSADVFALPCIIDSKGASDILPTVITEAMACHLPVVSTKLVGVPEMVVDGETGYLVEPGDPDAFADALQKLADDRPNAKKLGKAGRARMEKVFARSETSAQLAALFDPKLSENEQVRTPEEILVLSTSPSSVFADELAAFAADAEVCLTLGDAGPGELSSEVEYLPDATVLEAAWQFDPEARRMCDGFKNELGISAVDGEYFFTCARRAVYLRELIAKRPNVRHVHACRAADIPTVWLLKKLNSSLRVSAGVEDQPKLPRSGLVKMLAEFDVVSIGDAKLEAMLGDEISDRLSLKNIPKHRRVKIGPIKFNISNKPQEIDRGALVKEFLNLLRENRA